jgi:hypothetical protein
MIIQKEDEEELVSVILETNLPSLLEKYPNLKSSLENHPYILELQQKYREFLPQIQQISSKLWVHHTYHHLISGISLTLPKEAINNLNST